ncbi:hypothetical protein D3C87_323270 [compost metagenome]
MKYSIIGIIFLVLLLGGLFVYTESDSLSFSTQTSAPVMPQNDSAQYNIKLD